MIWTLLKVIFLVLIVALSVCAESEQEKNLVQFQWAFGALVVADGGSRFASVMRDTVLKTGDQLQFFISPQRACFLYVIYLSSENDVVLLFPTDLAHFDREEGIEGRHYLPGKGRWYKLDENTGIERFYVLGAAERLTELELLIKGHGSAKAEEKAEWLTKIQARIRTLRRQHRPTLSSEAEKPTAIAGVLRGTMLDIAQGAIYISAQNFYARTFSIDHR